MAKIRKPDTTGPGNKKKYKVTIVKNGPYLVSGNLPLVKEIIVTDDDGIPVKYSRGKNYPEQENYSLCRCGRSKKPPYCDGTHARIGFDGSETATHESYLEQAGEITGPDLDLTDAEELCAIARFCDRAGGVWRLTEDSDDPESRAIAIEEACNCPAGRLVAWEKGTGKSFELKFKPGISLVEDPDQHVSGPIWVKGGVPVVSSFGTEYEVRNRITLCRCGASDNKPFCDGSHISVGYSDGDESLDD